MLRPSAKCTLSGDEGSEHVAGSCVNLLDSSGDSIGTVPIAVQIDAADKALQYEEMTIDDVLENHVGGFGAYQKRSFLMAAWGMMVIGMVQLEQIVIERPLIQTFECDEDNKLIGELVDESSVYGSFSLVCDRVTMRAMLGSLTFVGFMFGAMIGGAVSDKTGRKKCSILSSLLMLIGSQCWAADSYYSYGILRFICGVGSGCGIVGIFVLQMEFVSKGHRGWMGSFGLNGSWSLGGIIVCIAAASIHAAAPYAPVSFATEWRKVALVTVCCAAVQMVLVFFSDETPTWLLSQGRVEEAWAVLERAASKNKTQVPARATCILSIAKKEDPNNSFTCANGGSTEGRQLPDVLKDKEPQIGAPLLPDKSGIQLIFSHELNMGVPMWRTTLLNFLCWFAAGCCYYGLALNTGNMDGDFYFNATIGQVCDIPALILSIPMLQYIGRRWTVSTSCILGGLSCIACVLLKVSDECAKEKFACTAFLMRTVFGTFGKMMYCITLSSVYIYALELFPPQCASMCLGVSSVAARIGSIIAPYIVLLAETNPDIPLSVFGGVSVIAGLGCFFMPDTRVKKGSLNKVVALNAAPFQAAPFQMVPELPELPALTSEAYLAQHATHGFDTMETSHSVSAKAQSYYSSNSSGEMSVPLAGGLLDKMAFQEVCLGAEGDETMSRVPSRTGSMSQSTSSRFGVAAATLISRAESVARSVTNSVYSAVKGQEDGMQFVHLDDDGKPFFITGIPDQAQSTSLSRAGEFSEDVDQWMHSMMYDPDNEFSSFLPGKAGDDKDDHFELDFVPITEGVLFQGQIIDEIKNTHNSSSSSLSRRSGTSP